MYLDATTYQYNNGGIHVWVEQIVNAPALFLTVIVVLPLDICIIVFFIFAYFLLFVVVAV